jgi:hypothetical protein
MTASLPVTLMTLVVLLLYVPVEAIVQTPLACGHWVLEEELEEEVGPAQRCT